jgi:hypothetical protein
LHIIWWGGGIFFFPFFSDLSEVYKVMMFEEMNWNHFRGTIWQIKRLLEGAKFPVNVKRKGKGCGVERACVDGE